MSDYLKILEGGDNTFDARSALKSSKIDLKSNVRPQPISLSCGTDWNGMPICVFGQGDYSAITGVGKSKKSFFKSAIIAIYQGLRDDTLFPGWKSHRDPNKLIIDIDTEQSDFHAQRAFRRVRELAGWEDENYHAFALRKHTPQERMQMVEAIVETYGSRIGLMCIDGYADLIMDTNDNRESMELVQKLMRWTDEYQFHITGILHTNPSGDKMRGHLGSDVSRKASTVIKLTADNDYRGYSKVQHVLARDESIDDFWLKIERGLPVFTSTDPEMDNL